MKRVWLRTEILSMLIIVALLSVFVTKAYTASELAAAQKLLSLRERESLEHAKEMIEDCLSKQPHHVQALCLLAETYLFYGDLLQQQDAINEWKHAQSLAKTALDLDPTSAEAHYLIAASMGRIGEVQGIIKSLFLVSPMFNHLEQALELDPDHAWSHYILSQLYNQLPEGALMKGDKKLALEYAQRACELNPTESEFSMLYAKLLIERKQPDAAKKILIDALASPTTPWTKKLRNEAERILQGL